MIAVTRLVEDDMPSSYAIGEHFEQLIDSLIESGRFQSRSEVVRAGLRLLEEREEERRFKLEKLRAEFQAGIDSGPRIPAEEVFSELKVKFPRSTRDRTS
jgi:antitoxin ParD1/3/4